MDLLKLTVHKTLGGTSSSLCLSCITITFELQMLALDYPKNTFLGTFQKRRRLQTFKNVQNITAQKVFPESSEILMKTIQASWKYLSNRRAPLLYSPVSSFAVGSHKIWPQASMSDTHLKPHLGYRLIKNCKGKYIRENLPHHNLANWIVKRPN